MARVQISPPDVVFPAVRFEQSGTVLYSAVMGAGDLIGMSQVDAWQKDDGNESGYQRLPERTRARKVAEYLARTTKALLPTSVLLCLRDKELSTYTRDMAEGVVEVSLPSDTVLWTVDGQHRIEGLRVAIEENDNDGLRDYPVPVVIMEGLSVVEEASQFRVINETAKKVRTDLARRILLHAAQKTAGGEAEIIKMGRMWEVRATDVVDHLLDNPDSPWAGRIQRPNQKKQKLHTVKELSFSNSLKPIVDNFPYNQYPAEKTAGILNEFWGAWKQLAPEAFEAPAEHVLLKTPGLFSMHQVLPYIYQVCQANGVEFTVDNVTAILKDLHEYAGAAYWSSENTEGASAYGSMKGFRILSDLIIYELQEAGYTLA